MKISYDSDREIFVAEFEGRPFGGTREERNVYWEQKGTAKHAGFRFDKAGKTTGKANSWWTNYAGDAAKLAKYATPEASEQIAKHDQKLESSRATSSDVKFVSPEGLDYLPFQCGGIEYMYQQKFGSLLGDDMGLGKTIQILGLVNVEVEVKNVLIVCPPTVRLNWRNEAKKWLVRDFNIHVVSGNTAVPADANFVIVGWSNLIQKKVKASLMARKWDIIAADEAHYASNPKAQRTKSLLGEYERVAGKGEFLKTEGLVHQSTRAIFATGTPILNRPLELWPILRAIDPKGLGSNFWRFVTRYCGAHNEGWGWSFDGATNLEELQEKLRSSVMIRRMKEDVLTELPAKRRIVVPFLPNGSKRLLAKEQKFVKEHQEIFDALKEAAENDDMVAYEAAIRSMKADKASFEEMSEIRHDIGMAKVDRVVEFVKDVLENDDAVVVFAHHRDVQDRLAEELAEYGVVRIMGGMSDQKKEDAKDAFQNDKSIRVFLGSLKACREGLTLTRSCKVVFAELDWVPAYVKQAEDRVRRIGQTRQCEFYHTVLEDSLDAYMAKIIVHKLNLTDKALDTKHERIALEVRELDMDKVFDEERVKQAKANDPLQIAVTTAVRLLSDVCDGARVEDGVGFNGTDTRFGKSLATQDVLSEKQMAAALRMLAKYHRQIPADVYRVIYPKLSAKMGI